MTWNLTLDILLVVLVLLFAPIGYMRGPVKELLVALGVAFGALTVEFWARPWGRDLDYYFNVGDDPGAFIIAMTFLMATTFIGGYGLGLLIAPWTFSIRGRLLGALISAINGALLVSFSLQYVRLFLLSDANEDALEQSYSVRILMNEVGWILLAAIALVPIAIGYGLITRRRAYDLRIWDDYEEDEYYEEYDPAYDYLDDDALEEQQTTWAPQASEGSHLAETRVMPPRVPPSPPAEESGYKSEPEPIPFRMPEATRPISVAELDEDAEQESAVSPEDLGGEWFAIGDTDPSMNRMDTAALEELDDEEFEAEAGKTPAAGSDEPLPEGYSRCQACHAVLPPGTGICPVCGHVH
ncbi:MAG: CvpA family protein [Thermomicrobiales bacterium]